MDVERKLDGSKFTKQWLKARHKISVGSQAAEVQCERIIDLKLSVMGTKTGPLTGFCDIKREEEEEEHVVVEWTDGEDKLDYESEAIQNDQDQGGTLNWDCPIQEATGDSVTLFDFKPGTGEHYGDPIADVYAVIARPNNAILALADGCNCGPKSRDAARRAVRGSIDYLNRRLFEAKHTPKTTQDVINVILQSFDSAQKCILQTDATTTSLCVAVVCELARPVRNKNWCVCMVNVGSSACYVWSNRKGIVQEVTYRCASDGSCLGHVIGDQPDKANLSCGFLPVHENDTIFLATSGISDNFDPVVLHEAGAKEVALDGRRESDASALANTTLLLSSEERETAKLSKLTELLLRTRTHKRVENLSAQLVTETLIDYAIQATDEKRRFLERCWNDDDYVDAEDKSAKEHEDLQLAEDYPGKVDHASVVAYKVGYLNEGQRPSLRKAFMYSPKM